MPNKPTLKQLDADNRDLRVRLEQAEATLSEILSGEADALFVNGAAGAQLFTLKGTDQSYRTLIENMSEGALTLTPEGLVLYANRRFAQMLRAPLKKVIGSELRNWIAPENRQILRDMSRKDAVDNHREELALAAADGTRVPVYLSASRPVLDEIDSVCMVVTDLTEQKRNEAILAEEKLARAILDQAADAIVICDETGRIMRASKQAQLFCSQSPLGQLFEQAFPLRKPDGTAFSAVGAVDRNLGLSEEARLEHDGQAVDLLVSVGHLKKARDELLGSVVTLTDISERKKTEARVIYLNRVYAVLSGINTLIVRVNDREELFREACSIAVEEGGFRMAMIVVVEQSAMRSVSVISAGKDAELLAAIKDVMSSSEGMQKTMVARAIREKKAIISNDTQNDPQLLFGKQYADAGVHSMTVLPLIISGEAVGAIVFYASEPDFFQQAELKLLAELAGDIAFAIDHIEQQERLNYLAYYDVLTGLANRTLFLERLAQHMRSAASGGHKLAIGLIDLERFKNINDSLGRPAGDALLKQVAEWLVLKAGDANLLARIDTDHFAIVLPEVRSDGGLAKLVDNLMAAFLDHPFSLNEAVFRIGVKVGIALFPDDGDEADTLFRNAEAALKKAKVSGDRFLFYTQKMTAAVAGKLALENQLRRAIDNEEFVLHYQPKVNLANGKVTGAEALIRWNNPETGLVPPGEFIPLLEETGLIHEVGRWALRKAIADNLRWRAAGLPVMRIAVNASPLQLRNINFLGEIEQAIAISAQAATGLELEITEGVFIDDLEYNIASLNAIRAMGITVAIDDFGTGFSSLSYLAKLPVDTLKIDRAFVIEMTVNPEGLALVSSIVHLAHSLNLNVVAEGVETEEQSHLLRLLQCDEMQGFLFSKPVPGDIFETRFLGALPLKINTGVKKGKRRDRNRGKPDIE